MANIYQLGFCRLIPKSKKFLSAKHLTVTSVCNVSGKEMRSVNPIERFPPYDYKKKGYGFINAFFDYTTKRFNDNTKVITVEGPPAVGKTAFAKALAEDLDMKYFPAVTMDHYYINEYGYDLRQLDDKLPESCKSIDFDKFHKDPHNRNVATMQIVLYMKKYEQYLAALAHLLNTGQGVILERTCYSDFVFLETMAKHGYVSPGARSAYFEIRGNTITELMQPHLVVYLDCPVKDVQEKMKARNDPAESTSKVYTDKYLKDLETAYKQSFLKEISVHAELLVYDWSKCGEVEVVVEDIERIDFDKYTKEDKKLRDWVKPKEWDWNNARMLYTDRANLMPYFNIPILDVPELIIPAEDVIVMDEVYGEAPGMKYEKGFNADMGDSGIWTKTS
ncbi:NADH dehydrogenase [ubiquinone] 1 alpha subcomplex subunit 10, mitochondrial-like [Ctenocephalides felis]|uniref:NADH dehydrogenase [ubiquinone] 1 alpha subcomplex subunit 10, mitochondrial-like n=1 Tax=Ctenocephalides felis TaxID=7515 RepID=UPI000E6E5A93|nr:NADH dehydrogenase [ubiquinone] 1 alpha subcomplex subunit 10, mitochondrial-like [Ctenocephalides felis]